MTAKCAIDALRIVKERKNDIHLILTDTHLPDMGRYELLEKIMEQTSTLPIVGKFFIFLSRNLRINRDGVLSETFFFGVLEQPTLNRGSISPLEP